MDYVDLPEEVKKTKGEVSTEEIDKRKAKEKKMFESGVVEEPMFDPFDLMSITISVGKTGMKAAAKTKAAERLAKNLKDKLVPKEVSSVTKAIADEPFEIPKRLSEVEVLEKQIKKFKMEADKTGEEILKLEEMLSDPAIDQGFKEAIKVNIEKNKKFQKESNDIVDKIYDKIEAVKMKGAIPHKPVDKMMKEMEGLSGLDRYLKIMKDNIDELERKKDLTVIMEDENPLFKAFLKDNEIEVLKQQKKMIEDAIEKKSKHIGRASVAAPVLSEKEKSKEEAKKALLKKVTK